MSVIILSDLTQNVDQVAVLPLSEQIKYYNPEIVLSSREYDDDDALDDYDDPNLDPDHQDKLDKLTLSKNINEALEMASQVKDKAAPSLANEVSKKGAGESADDPDGHSKD